MKRPPFGGRYHDPHTTSGPDIVNFTAETGLSTVADVSRAEF